MRGEQGLGQANRTGTYMNHNDTLVVSYRNIIGALSIGNAPRALQCVAESVFETVSVCVPDFDGAVLRARNDDGERWVENGE